MCSPRKSNENFSIFTFYESKQMSLTQDLRWSLGRSIALQLQRQTDLLLCTINCFLQWDHLPNMAVGDLAFYYTLYLWMVVVVLRSPIHANEPNEYNGMLYRTSNRVLNNGIKVIILICMDGTSQYHHHPMDRITPSEAKIKILYVKPILYDLL